MIDDDVTELHRVQRERDLLSQELSTTKKQLQDEIQQREETRRATLSLTRNAQIARAALKENDAAMEEYARLASHDLQEPLRKIESFARVLVEDYGGKLDTQARMYLDIMVDAANRMRRLIRNVVAFSRAGAVEKPFGPVDLNQVLAAAKDNLSAHIQDRQAEVLVHALPTVYADETQMLQLFQNLIENSLKFNKSERPKVEIYAEENRDEWKIFTKDNGIGVRESERQTIFTPFKRLHSRQEYEGTGIGLAICRRIVARHGGNIGVTSEACGGSMFWLTMPKATRHLQIGTTNKEGVEHEKGEIHESSTS